VKLLTQRKTENSKTA